jgi:hypothetical protein
MSDIIADIPLSTSTMTDIVLRNKLKYNEIPSNIPCENSSKFSPKGIIIRSSNPLEISKKIISKISYIVYAPKNYSTAITDFGDIQNKIILSLPQYASNDELLVLRNLSENFEAIEINNLYGFFIAKSKNILLGPYFNQLSKEIELPKVLSVEADKISDANDFVYCYGKINAMLLKNCIFKEKDKSSCSVCRARTSKLVDEYGVKFDFYSYKIKNCYLLLKYGPIVNPAAIKSQNLYIDFETIDKQEMDSVFEQILLGSVKGYKSNFARELR